MARISIEIPIFLVFFALTLCAPVLTNLIIYRTCYVIFDFDKTECALLGTKDADNTTAELEKKVQPYANIMGMTRSMIDAVTGCIVCVFLGSWSDRHGRRPVILLSLAGFTAGYAFTTMFAFFEYVTPWILVATVLLNFTGGIATFMSVALCHITDSTTEHDRGAKMGLLDASLMSGMLLGTLLSSFVFSAIGYVALLGICTLCLTAALLFAYFFISESVPVQESENRLRDIASTIHIRDTFKVVFKKREQNNRAILLLLIAVMTLCVLVSNDGGTLFLFLRSSFLWSLEKYTIFSAATGVYSIVATILVVYLLHKLLKISESILILAGLVSLLNSALMIGVAKNNTHIYAAAVAKGPASGISPMIRTLMSKIVPQEEMGKLFSFFAPLEVLSSLLILPLYTLVYNATIDILPSAYSFMSAGFAVLAMVTLAVVMHLQRRQRTNAVYRSVATNT